MLMAKDKCVTITPVTRKHNGHGSLENQVGSALSGLYFIEVQRIRAGIIFLHSTLKKYMNGFLRTLIAGYGAKKLGGGCFGTILVFVLIYFLLGQCN